MLEDVVATASLWTAVAEWFTPTVFFVLLNVVIGTIAVTSKASHGHRHSSGGGVKSGAEHHNAYGNASGIPGVAADDHHNLFHDAAPPARQLSRTGSMLQRLKSFNLSFQMYRNRPEDYGVVAVPAEPTPADARASVEEKVETPRRAAAKPKQKQPLRRDPSPPAQTPCQPQRPQQQQLNHHLRDEEPALDDAAEFETLEEAFLAASGGDEHHHLERIQSDTQPTAGEMTRKLASTMKKSASTKSAFAHFEANDLPRRPATTREDRRPRLEAPVDYDEEEEDVEQIIAAATAGRKSVTGQQNTEVDARADDFINRFRNQLKLQRLESLMRYKDMLNRGR